MRKLLQLLPFAHGATSKLALILAFIRIKLGIQKSLGLTLTIDGTRTVTVRLAGTRDELTILRDLFVGQEYAAPEHIEVRTILDLGANIGLASAWFRLAYPNARIHAYEPAPRAFALLKKNAQTIKNMEVFAEAIGAHAGTVTFHESDRSVASSLVQSQALEVSHDVQVPMVTIDTALERAGNQVDLLKIDIEGAEFDALAAAERLSKALYITGEAHPKAAKRSLEEIRIALAKTHDVRINGTDEVRLAGFYASLH
jgi:FkbM family methyltransferase